MKISSIRALLLTATCLSAAQAESVHLSSQLASLSFLLGDWTGTGKTETGTARGTSSMHPLVGGAAILRKDHTDTFGPDGKAAGTFDQAMMVYGDGGQIHADYLDGEHVIHYLSAEITPDASVSFLSDVKAAGPVFRLTYSKLAEGLHVRFEMRSPGQSAFVTLADGDLQRGGRSPMSSILDFSLLKIA